MHCVRDNNLSVKLQLGDDGSVAYTKHETVPQNLIFICPCIAYIIPNYNQQDATFLDLFISTDALHVSGGPSAHHQELITVHTASGTVNCNGRVKWIASKFVYKISG